MFSKNAAGNGADRGAIPDAFADVADHTMTDHGRDALIALAVNLAICQDGGKTAIAPLDDLDGITTFRPEGVIDFGNCNPKFHVPILLQIVLFWTDIPPMVDCEDRLEI